MKRIILAALLLMIPALPHAAQTTRLDRPHWSLELKGGAFLPDAAQWSDYYGNSYLGEFGAALSYKVLRQVEAGVEGSYSRATGKGQQPQHGGAARGRVTHQQVPLNLFVLARGVFDEDQWLVPYAGGGYTRLFYSQKVAGEEKVEGSVNGYHARGGIQLLLDRLEPATAAELYNDFGMHHSYFFLEGRYLRADADRVSGGSVNIGGMSYLGGFLFEF